MKGKQAARAFRETRAVRFAESRERTAVERSKAVAEGRMRETVVVRVAEVQDTDMVALTAGGFGVAGDTDESLWGTSEGVTFVQRFRA